jgi:hypothetical protein
VQLVKSRPVSHSVSLSVLEQPNRRLFPGFRAVS